MKIYKYIADSDIYDSLLFEEKDWDKADYFASGDRLPPELKYFSLQDHIVGKKGDFPSLNPHIPVFTPKAWKQLNHLLSQIETLSLNQGEYMALNVLNIVDALDKTQSELTQNRVTGRVSSIQKYVFMEEKLHNKHLFKIPETLGLEVYVSDTFKKVVEDNGLEGLSFEKLVYES